MLHGATLRSPHPFGGDVDLADAREGVGAAKRRAVEHALAPEVACVLELALHFRHGVLARRGLPDDAADLDASTWTRWCERHAGDARFIAIVPGVPSRCRSGAGT